MYLLTIQQFRYQFSSEIQKKYKSYFLYLVELQIQVWESTQWHYQSALFACLNPNGRKSYTLCRCTIKVYTDRQTENPHLHTIKKILSSWQEHYCIDISHH